MMLENYLMSNKLAFYLKLGLFQIERRIPCKSSGLTAGHHSTGIYRPAVQGQLSFPLIICMSQCSFEQYFGLRFQLNYELPG